MKNKTRGLCLTVAAGAVCALLMLAGSATGTQDRPAHPQYKLRFGKLSDTDAVAGDGLFNFARGSARCKSRERLISGGLRLHGGSAAAIAGHFQLIESGPVPSQRRWAVTANSDLGGEARQDFLVVAYCRTS